MTDTPEPIIVESSAPAGTTRHVGKLVSIVTSPNSDGDGFSLGLLVDIGEEQLVQAFPNDQAGLVDRLVKAVAIAARIDVWVSDDDRTLARAYKLTLA